MTSPSRHQMNMILLNNKMPMTIDKRKAGCHVFVLTKLLEKQQYKFAHAITVCFGCPNEKTKYTVQCFDKEYID